MRLKTLDKPTVALIGFPMDLGADRRGVDMGPSALRIAGIRERLEALGYHTEDLGDIPIQIKERQVVENPRLKYLAEIVKTSEHLAGMIRSVLEALRFPICMGGDHAMALGTIAGIAAFCQKTGQTPGVIWIDAHADMNTDETTPSGNIHGMPLAASLGRGHRQLTQLLGFGPKLAEVNPILDHRNRSAEFAAELVASSMGLRIL